MTKLSASQKEAIAALFTELFNAESIIEIQKIKLLNQKLQEYGISSRSIKHSKCLTLEEAVSIICTHEDLQFKENLIKDLEIIARRDGYCSPEEAILLQALKVAIVPAKGRTSVDGLIFSMHPNKLNFDGKKATYIHPDKNLLPDDDKQHIDMYADKIMRHLDELVLLFYCFGYDFVYIPKLREDYGMNPELQEELKNFSFFFSNLPKDSIEKAIAAFGVLDDSRRFSTAKFANMLFSGRKRDIPSEHDSPAFLIKVSDSYAVEENCVVDGKKESKQRKYYNFLYLPIVADGISGIIDTAKGFFQDYIDRVDLSSYIVRPESSKRLRHFDLYQSLIARIAREGIVKARPRIILDLSHRTNETLIFEKANDGKDVTVPLKSYVVEYLYVLWCTAKADKLADLDKSEFNIAAKDIWFFIHTFLKDSKVDRDIGYESFKKGFSKKINYLTTSFTERKLKVLVANLGDYLPHKTSSKDTGPATYRIAARDIGVVEQIDGKPCSFEKSSICQALNAFFDE